MSRHALFDLAVNRALSYGNKLGVDLQDSEALIHSLKPWHLQTRFTYRIPLTTIVDTLKRCPGAAYYWEGGPDGDWKKGHNPRP